MQNIYIFFREYRGIAGLQLPTCSRSGLMQAWLQHQVSFLKFYSVFPNIEESQKFVLLLFSQFILCYIYVTDNTSQLLMTVKELR